MRKLRSSKNKQASDSDDSRQEETVHEILVRNRKESVFERPGPVGLPSQNPLQNPFQDPKTPNQGAQARDAGWASVNPPRDHALSSSVDLEGLRPTIEKWKATPPRKPMNYQPMGFGPPKTEQKSPASPPGNLCENTTRCLNSTYDSDKTTIDHLKRAQKRLREDYEQFEEEVEDSIEVRGIDDRQHKRIRRIRTRLRDQFEELGNDLDNFENKKYNDHKRVLEYLGADPKKSQ
ncbi:hypothetical protein N7452_005854 [Penicillium brevicompactum]|uniref:Uncharacterized protein n=1 Tax=Penicillium brevicompactum TaxID=5074 RepID=A0A9W9UHV0_PENBR|nr:hypothetical protein N7452_005854 [Penicillium brevicompactum]